MSLHCSKVKHFVPHRVQKGPSESVWITVIYLHVGISTLDLKMIRLAAAANQILLRMMERIHTAAPLINK